MITLSLFLLGVFLISYICLFNNTIYCFLCEREDYNMFNKLNKIDNDKFYCINKEFLIYKGIDPTFKCTDFPDIHIKIYEDGAAIFDDKTYKCTSTFYKRGSKKLAEKLKPLIDFNI